MAEKPDKTINQSFQIQLEFNDGSVSKMEVPLFVVTSGLDVDFGLFETLTNLKQFPELAPDIDVDFFEVFRYYEQQDWSDLLLASPGEKCQSATNQKECISRYESLKPVKFDWTGLCSSSDCYSYIKFQRGDSVGIITKNELPQFLGVIDTPLEAILLTTTEAYNFLHGDNGIRTTSSDYQLVMNKRTRFCNPYQRNEYLLEVTREGALTFWMKWNNGAIRLAGPGDLNSI